MRETLRSGAITTSSGHELLCSGRASVTSLSSSNKAHDITGDEVHKHYDAWGNLQLRKQFIDCMFSGAT
jgi:hypothetical protein